MSILNLNEITSGLVAHLDPDIIRDYEVDCGVKGKHDFLILSVVGNQAWVLPLTSKPGKPCKPRVRIPPQYKHGHPRWTNTDTYVLDKPIQVPCYVVQEASKDEFSRPGERNRVDREFVEQL